MKTGLANEDAGALLRPRAKLGRPVKWRAERSEDFLAAHMAADQHDEAELALDQDGRILGCGARVTANFGATRWARRAIIRFPRPEGAHHRLRRAGGRLPGARRR